MYKQLEEEIRSMTLSLYSYVRSPLAFVTFVTNDERPETTYYNVVVSHPNPQLLPLFTSYRGIKTKFPDILTLTRTDSILVSTVFDPISCTFFVHTTYILILGLKSVRRRPHLTVADHWPSIYSVTFRSRSRCPESRMRQIMTQGSWTFSRTVCTPRVMYKHLTHASSLHLRGGTFRSEQRV